MSSARISVGELRERFYVLTGVRPSARAVQHLARADALIPFVENCSNLLFAANDVERLFANAFALKRIAAALAEFDDQPFERLHREKLEAKRARLAENNVAR